MSKRNVLDSQKRRVGLAASLIGAIVLLLIIFGVIVSAIGLFNFTDAFKREYSTSTYHMADTATTFINGDHLADYLAGRETEEYLQTKEDLDLYCQKIHVSLVYVIVVDRSDYGRFVSVFNSVDNSVDDSEYTPWELGHKRDTTNDEYRQKYRALYEQTEPYETVYRIKTTDGQHPHITTMVPVKNSVGEVTAILCMQRPVRELHDARRPYLVRIAVSALLLAAFSAVFYAVYMRKQVVNPLTKVSDEAARFAKENVQEDALGAQISKIKEISDLAVSIDKMEADMVESIRNLTAVTAEKERIGTELALASTIQENSIPNIFPAFPERDEFDIYASMTPAKEVGGDFYNFFLIDDDRLAMVIGDVSGKGVPAALFMMVTNILISDRLRLGGTPAEVLTFVNHDLCAHNKADMFVTLWVGILDLSTGKLTAANAGHEYPVIRRPNGEYTLHKDRHGLVAAAMDGVRYKDYELQMQSGSALFVYTDGVPEATDAEGNMFGVERMLAALNESPDAPPQEALQNVRRAVDGFVREAEQFDDLTMLCLEYKKEK